MIMMMMIMMMMMIPNVLDHRKQMHELRTELELLRGKLMRRNALMEELIKVGDDDDDGHHDHDHDDDHHHHHHDRHHHHHDDVQIMMFR
jgi:hypothetical protein